MTRISPDLKNIIEQIRPVLADHLSKQEDDALQEIEVCRIEQRPFSNVAVLQIRTSKKLQRLVMKTTVHHPVNKVITERENQAVVEYNILKYLYPKFEGIEKCGVPRPILVMPEIETYVMSFIEGHLLSDEFHFARYLSTRTGFNSLIDHYYHSGRWLKLFQEFSKIRAVTAIALDDIIRRCDYRLRMIEEAKDSRCPMRLRRDVMDFVYEQQEQLAGEPILVSGRHGDFGSWNIITGSQGITVIDFLGYGEDSIAIDPLKMLMNLEDEMKYLMYSPNRILKLKESFLKGLGPLPSIPEPVLIICETLHRVCSVLASISIREGSFHHKISRRRCLKTNVDWLTSGKKKKLLWEL